MLNKFKEKQHAAYDAMTFREQIALLGVSACIKPRRNRKDNIPFNKK